MTKEELLKILFEFNEDELFYQQYYQLSNNPDALNSFLTNFGDEEILKRNLYIPEVASTLIPSDLSDEDYFQMNTMHSVFISKHNRYTPIFSHWHGFYEIVYVLDGSCKQTIGAKTISMVTGDFCFIAPHTLHSVSVFDSSIVINILIRHNTFTDLFFNILRNDNIISNFFNQILFEKQFKDYLIFNTNNDSQIKDSILDMYLEFANKKKYNDILLNNMMMTLFIRLLRDYEHTAISSQVHQHSNQDTIAILSYIQDHYRNITLQELAEHFHYTVSYCSRLIKKSTGQSYSKILQNIRYEKAKILLSTTDNSINDISIQVGIVSIEHFNRTFKKLYNMTPGQYRNIHKK